jgi:hypothetical protein
MLRYVALLYVTYSAAECNRLLGGKTTKKQKLSSEGATQIKLTAQVPNLRQELQWTSAHPEDASAMSVGMQVEECSSRLIGKP